MLFSTTKYRISIAMTNHMVIVSSYRASYNAERKYYEIISLEKVCCPYCGGSLEYRNSRERGVSDELRNKAIYLLRRLWCAGCKHLHTEIPDIIQPYKHYSSSVIQDVLDGGGETCGADDSTIRRWRSGFKDAKADIEQRLKSIYARETEGPVPLITGVKTLDSLIKAEPRWLAYVMKLLICHGHRLCTRFAFCPGGPPDKVAIIDVSKRQGGKIYDKTKEDTG